MLTETTAKNKGADFWSFLTETPENVCRSNLSKSKLTPKKTDKLDESDTMKRERLLVNVSIENLTKPDIENVIDRIYRLRKGSTRNTQNLVKLNIGT